MTFREKLTMEYPNHIDDNLAGGCVGCPHTHGYEPYEDRPCVHTIYSCTKCWNRTIPGTEEPSIKPDLDALIERAATKKDISVSIFITGDSTHISIYPCPDPSEKKGNPVAEAYKYLVNDSIGAVDARKAAVKKLEEALEC